MGRRFELWVAKTLDFKAVSLMGALSAAVFGGTVGHQIGVAISMHDLSNKIGNDPQLAKAFKYDEEMKTLMKEALDVMSLNITTAEKDEKLDEIAKKMKESKEDMMKLMEDE